MEVPLETAVGSLFVPSLEELRDGLRRELGGNYADVEVDVVGCPDLREWGLAFEGLGGSERLLDVGGVPNLLNPSKHRISFDLNKLAACAELAEGCFLGASSGDANFVGCNSELVPCESIGSGVRTTRVATVGPNGEFVLNKYDHSRIGFLGNLFLSEGKPGNVVAVKVAKRSEGSEADFTAALRDALIRAFPDQAVGVGLVFQLNSGKFRAHIMPDFKKTTMVDGPEVDAWLRYFEFGPHATFLGTIVTKDPTDGQLNLRFTHTHFFNENTGQGGHYHNDTTPQEASYTAYLTPAKSIYRIENAFKHQSTQ